jgi:DNA-binding MarR family transcriptional regulator
MSKTQHPADDVSQPRAEVSMPVLLRHARLAYAAAMRKALDAAGFADLPKNGLYVIGGLAHAAAARPLSRLIEELRLSKQAAGQLVDTLVMRDYLEREVDDEDRRRLTIGLTQRGRAAAAVLAAAGATVDEELRSRIDPKDLERARRTLCALVDIGREMLDGGGAVTIKPKQKRVMEIVNTRAALHVNNADCSESRFDDVNLQVASFTNVNLGGARFSDVNLASATIDDANLTGMAINGLLVTDLLRAFDNRAPRVNERHDPLTPDELLSFMRAQPWAIEASVTPQGAPQAAVLGVAVTDHWELLFDTVSRSRKHQNLLGNPRVAFVIGWDEERTVQYEGIAEMPTPAELPSVQACYFDRFPDGRSRETWPGLVYWRVRPSWIRYSDFNADPPLMQEWDAAAIADAIARRR